MAFSLLFALPPAADDVHVGPVAGRGRRVGYCPVLDGQVAHVTPAAAVAAVAAVAAAGSVPVAFPPEKSEKTSTDSILHERLKFYAGRN